MLAKLLGAADILSCVVLVLLHFHIVSWSVGFVFSAYLIVKAVVFRSSIVSLLDGACGIYLFVLIFGFSTFITWIAAVYLLQKAAFSLAAE